MRRPRARPAHSRGVDSSRSLRGPGVARTDSRPRGMAHDETRHRRAHRGLSYPLCPSSRATTERRSSRGERIPLSSAVGTGRVCTRKRLPAQSSGRGHLQVGTGVGTPQPFPALLAHRRLSATVPTFTGSVRRPPEPRPAVSQAAKFALDRLTANSPAGVEAAKSALSLDQQAERKAELPAARAKLGHLIESRATLLAEAMYEDRKALDLAAVKRSLPTRATPRGAEMTPLSRDGTRTLRRLTRH
jgi:hypothetical protein